MNEKKKNNGTRFLDIFPVVIEHKIQWSDMDAYGHVNNVVYFRYIENARIAYYEAMDKYAYEDQTGTRFVVAKTGCTFKLPLTYPDTLLIGARVTEIKGSHIAMKYCIVSTAQTAVAAEADAVIVSYHYGRGKKVRFPKELAENITELEGWNFAG